MKYSVGTKIYSYDKDDELVIFRIRKADDEKEVYDLFNLNTNTSCQMTFDEVHNNFVRLKPDGIMMFYIVKDSDQIRDVLVTLHPFDKNGQISSIPYAACRQDCVDIFSQAEKKTPIEGQIWAGCSISEKTCPAETSVAAFMNCEEFQYSRVCAVYLDDTLDSILDNVYTNKFDNILETYKKKHYGDNLVGICTSLKELLEDKDFMLDFHYAFDITEVPFPILPKETDNLLLSIVEQVKSIAVKQVYVLPYDKTIDLKEFQRPYILCTPQYRNASPEQRKIYIVGYDEDPEVDALMKKYGTNSREELVAKLGFKEL